MFGQDIAILIGVHVGACQILVHVPVELTIGLGCWHSAITGICRSISTRLIDSSSVTGVVRIQSTRDLVLVE